MEKKITLSQCNRCKIRKGFICEDTDNKDEPYRICCDCGNHTDNWEHIGQLPATKVVGLQEPS